MHERRVIVIAICITALVAMTGCGKTAYSSQTEPVTESTEIAFPSVFINETISIDLPEVTLETWEVDETTTETTVPEKNNEKPQATNKQINVDENNLPAIPAGDWDEEEPKSETAYPTEETTDDNNELPDVSVPVETDEPEDNVSSGDKNIETELGGSRVDDNEGDEDLPNVSLGDCWD